MQSFQNLIHARSVLTCTTSLNYFKLDLIVLVSCVVVGGGYADGVCAWEFADDNVVFQ